MAKDKPTNEEWEDAVPDVCPYFDPAGVYRACITVKIEQYGRMAPAAGNSEVREFQPLNPPIECYNGDQKYETLPVDGVQIVAIVLLKAQEKIQAGGMLTRTPIGEGNEQIEAMVRMLNEPAVPEDTLKALGIFK